MGDYTDSTVDVDEIFAQLNSKEIAFGVVNKLAQDNKISGADFGRIVQETLEPHAPLKCCVDLAETIKRSLDYQEKQQEQENFYSGSKQR